VERRLRTIVPTDTFTRQFAALRAKHPRLDEFMDGVRFVLERDPSEGYQWGTVWVLSSVGMALDLPLVSVFYTFDEESVRLHSIIEIALM